ncbi:MAG: ArsC/Spx/MgsR family protein, partial [Pseudomonadota bacterium]
AAGADTLINRRSTTWRGLSEDERSTDPQSLLTEHPTLIKRPVIEAGEAIHVGWTRDVQAALL